MSSSISPVSGSEPNGNVPATTITTKNETATSTSNSTVGNISTLEGGGGGGADGVSSSYYVFVLTVIGACVLNVLEV